MRKIQLLDCTLRDGGFINDWKFGYNSIRDIINRLNKASVDIIEIGFIDGRRPIDKDRTIFPTVKSSNVFFENNNVNHAMIVGMIDFGTCDIENICSREDCYIDGIRVIFKKHDMKKALDFCGELKKKGYRLFIQPVSITSYNDYEVLELIESVNKLEPYAVSIVDTYGLMFKEDLFHYYHLFDHNLSPVICLGYHSHNNYQLAYANCTEFLRYYSLRDIIIDASLYGMGKSAGNANTELLVSFLNRYFDKAYDLNQILECIDINILKIYEHSPWGYSMHYFLSADNDCHPNYIQHLTKKNTLSIKSINDIISMIPQEEKLTYNKELTEQLYLKYQKHNIDDSLVIKEITQILNGKKILILAPGHTLATHKDTVLSYIKTHEPVVFSVNFISGEYPVDYIFVSNSKRYVQISDIYFSLNPKPKVISTSNIVESFVPFSYVLNYANLLNNNQIIIDNSVLILLNLFFKMREVDIMLAGFDGFSSVKDSNYLNDFYSFPVDNDNYNLRNSAIAERLSELRQYFRLSFLTPSLYMDMMT